jgi:hypothetical protein
MKLTYLSLLIGLLSTPLYAESLSLSSGEVIEGSLIEFPKEIIVLLPDGIKKTYPYNNVTSIYKNQPPASFTPFVSGDKKPKTEPEKTIAQEFPEIDASKGPYASPQVTFMTWKAAAIKGDIDAMADCYASYRKSEIKKEMKKIPKKTREDMRRAMVDTIFSPSDPYFQDSTAIMEVSWTKGLASQNQTLKFALENNKDWKIVE